MALFFFSRGVIVASVTKSIAGIWMFNACLVVHISIYKYRAVDGPGIPCVGGFISVSE